MLIDYVNCLRIQMAYVLGRYNRIIHTYEQIMNEESFTSQVQVRR